MFDTDCRLPTNVKPIHYDLTIRTSLVSRSFEGSGSILLKVLEPHLTSLTLNAHPSLELHSYSLSLAQSQTDSVHPIPDSAVKRDGQAERVTIQIDDTLDLKQGDELRLNLGWKAPLGTSNCGYYLSKYRKQDTNEEDVYALTLFGPTDARKVFPCWDEPALKATYSVTMISAASSVNLSNMPVIAEETLDASPAAATQATPEAWKVTKFDKTPPMSTYLLTFATGPFMYKEASFVSPLSGKKVPLRIYATSDLIEQTSYALEITKRCLPMYEKMFDIPYVLPKLDSLVVTEFDGAMEGWGLITGETGSFLCDKTSSLATQKRVTDTQSHEVAHQWFGNLVTMEWWDGLWLNEAFATWVGEILVPDQLYPEWQLRTTFLTEHLFNALALDSRRSSHPIELPCTDANKVNETFDGISYSKGAAVLRMLSTLVGEDVFLKGVSLYLKDKAYGNGVTEDLWKGISTASGIDVAKIINPWILKIGFPVLTVTEIEGGQVSVRQDRFLSTGDVKDEENETIWPVPLQLLTISADGKKSIDTKAFLSERGTTISLDGTPLYKFNADTTGVYRVAYSPSHLNLLGLEAAKRPSALSPEDRVGLVSDAHRLARAGYSSTTGALSFIAHLKDEETEVVWSAVSSFIADLYSVWWEQPEPVIKGVDALRLSLFGPLIDRLGYEFRDTDSPETVELRTLAFGNAGVAGHTGVIAYSLERFARFIAGGDEQAIHPDLRASVFRLAVVHTGRSAYDTLKAIYTDPSSKPALKKECLRALTHAVDGTLIAETLEMLLPSETNGPTLTQSEILLLLAGLSSNPASRRQAWEWRQVHWDALYDQFKDSSFTVNRLVKSLGSLSSRKDLEEVRRFFEGKETEKFGRSLEQTLEGIGASGGWVERGGEEVRGWLEERGFLR